MDAAASSFYLTQLRDVFATRSPSTVVLLDTMSFVDLLLCCDWSSLTTLICSGNLEFLSWLIQLVLLNPIRFLCLQTMRYIYTGPLEDNTRMDIHTLLSTLLPCPFGIVRDRLLQVEAGPIRGGDLDLFISELDVLFTISF